MSEVFSKLEGALAPGRRARAIGLTGAARGWALSRAVSTTGRALVCLTPDEDSADALANDLKLFCEGAVLRLPADEMLPWDELVSDAECVTQRLGTLTHLARGAPFDALVLSVRAAVRRVLPPQIIRAHHWQINLGEDAGRDDFARKLEAAGYRNVPLVEDPGTYSLRGDIVDVWPPLADQPTRLEFFGDTVEAMRPFDPGSQRTEDGIKALELTPARELLLNDATRPVLEASIRQAAEEQDVPTSKVRERLEQVREGLLVAGLEALLPGLFEEGLVPLFDALPLGRSPVVWVDGPTQVDQALAQLEEEIDRSHRDAQRRHELVLGPDRHFISRAALEQTLSRLPVLEGGGLTLDDGGGEAATLRFSFGATKPLRDALLAHHGEESALAPLLERLRAWRAGGFVVTVAVHSAGQGDRVKRLLSEHEVRVSSVARALSAAGVESLRQAPADVHLVQGEPSAGFIDEAARLVVLSDEDLFGPKAHRPQRRRRHPLSGAAASFKDLKEGDLCVHRDFGVCRYEGLVTMAVEGVANEFLVLQFAGRDKIYLPVGRLRLISKFTGADPEKAVLDKLGGGTWDKKKLFVKEQLLKMAAELLRLYAERSAHPGFAFSPPDRYFHQFEADFEFTETPDQQKAIDDVLADMQRGTPMDRLVCGDVGYGKTEVAMRAAFKAVLDRKQVAVLVPTTLLAHQHHTSFQRRFAGYPVSVEEVSGLRTAGEVKDVLQRAREGRVDVVIGTHKLLAANIAFKSLGLLIIDEEQKFGVKQKETLRRLKTDVDTLTLSATPIPRTLNMAMSGMRDLSLITTPPADRRAIRTFVNRFDPKLIADAIAREVKRGGQVFFIHNRVESLGEMERFLRELVPQVSMVVAHGQMPEGQLEKVMLEFVERRAQLLLCTSIVESGIDIPSANTMIVNRADQFGLSQLYQLRGRVGRSKERAYAYLLVPHDRAVTKDASRRLEVLQSFTELGVGFSIATHDLELRGAGSLLGQEQSGSIEAVGFELYQELLEEAIAEARGEPARQQIEPELNLPLPAYLPEIYVPDVHQRLVLYKRLSQAQSEAELEDLRAELIDRFGDLPAEVEHLLEVMLLRQEMRRLALRQLDAGAKRLVVTLGPEARLDGHRLHQLVERSRGLYRLTPDLKLVVTLEASVQGTGHLAAARKALGALASVARIEG